jgi:nucleoside 2-deoxyribosyltransferase
MKKRVFITAKFKGLENKIEIEHLCELVKESGFEDFCFVRDVEGYEKAFNDPKEMMAKAKGEIEKSDILLVDITDKPSGGRALEVGIAFALNKKVLIIMKKGTEIKNTWEGVADTIIEYEKLEDIVPDLKIVLSSYK